MRTIQKSDSHEYCGKSAAANSKADDETAYLLRSRANAERLLKSIDTLLAGTTSTGKQITLTETLIV